MVAIHRPEPNAGLHLRRLRPGICDDCLGPIESTWIFEARAMASNPNDQKKRSSAMRTVGEGVPSPTVRIAELRFFWSFGLLAIARASKIQVDSIGPRQSSQIPGRRRLKWRPAFGSGR